MEFIVSGLLVTVTVMASAISRDILVHLISPSLYRERLRSS